MQYPWLVWRTDMSKPTVDGRCLRAAGGQKSFTMAVVRELFGEDGPGTWHAHRLPVLARTCSRIRAQGTVPRTSAPIGRCVRRTKRSPERANEMNILGLRSEQLGMNRFGQAASLAEIEANC